MTSNDCEVEWCTHHETYGHRGLLARKVDDAAPGAPRYALTVNERLNGDGTSFSGRPEINLQTRGATAVWLDPDGARELASALQRAAEIVDARLSETCRQCGRATSPEEDRLCASCNERRQALHVIDGGQS